MYRRLIGAAGISLALLGCTEDPSRLSVVDESTGVPPSAGRPEAPGDVPPLLAALDDKPPVRPDGKPATAKDLLEKAKQVANGGDLASAISLLEQAHKLDAKDRDVLFFLILAQQIRAGQLPEGKGRSAMFLESAATARTLRALATEPNPNEKGMVAQALFNEACAFARDKQADKALASLKEAVDYGFLDDKAIASDEALVSIRDRPEFTGLVAKVKEAATKAMKERDDAMTKQVLPEVKSELASFKSFPFSFELPGLDGKPVKLADAKGKVTIVDIWGTWCPPCRMEIPHFVALRENYKDKGVEIIGLNYEKGPKGKEKETIDAFVKENGLTYTLALGDDKTMEMVPEFSGFPTTLFLDREGKVRYKHTGYAPYEVLEYIVKTLLDEKSAKP